MNKIARLLIAVFLCIAPNSVLAAEYDLADGSIITYHVHHPMHDVKATGNNIAALKTFSYDVSKPADFSSVVNIPLQASWESFDSENKNRDANTKMLVKASQFPMITYVIEKIELTSTDTHPFKGAVSGRMYVAGNKTPLTATVTIDISNPDRLHVDGQLQVNMTDFGIDPPKLLMFAADDAVRIELDLYFEPAKE